MQLAELEVPASAEFVGLARLVVSSLAGDQFLLSDDQLDNLKLAVSEAAVMVIKASEGDGTVRIRCEAGAEGVDIIVDGSSVHFDVGVDGLACAGVANELGVPLMSSLVDEVVVVAPEGASGPLRLGVRCSPTSPL